MGSDRHDVPLVPQVSGRLHWLPGFSPAFVVKNITQEPSGARETVGSCANTGCATSCRVNSHGRLLFESAVACTTLELERQDLIPTLLVISALNMW